MAWFEVFIPSLDGGNPGITLTLEAPNWIGALRTGLQNIGEGQASISNVMCDIKEDNSIHVTDVASHRVFRLREVEKPGLAPPPPPAPEPPRSTGPKTLLEFQRPDFSKLTPSGEPTDEDDDGDPDTIQTTAFEAPTAFSSSPPSPAPAVPPPAPTGQSTIEMSIPWATMPPPSSALPGVTLPSPTLPSPTLPSSPSPSLPTSPVTQVAERPYDLTLRQPKAPRTTAPLPSEDPATMPLDVPRDISIPPASSPSPAPPSPVSPPAPVAAPAAFPPLPPTPSFPPPPASPPAASATPPVAKPTAPAPARSPDPQRAMTTSVVPRVAPAEATERLERAPGRGKTGPVPSPTPRGTPAPPPKRRSGQFESAPPIVSREVSRENPALAPAQRVSAEVIADAVADVFDATQDLLMEGVVEPRRVAEALLDIALAHVPAESGSFYLADLNGHVLSFAAVRGPRADAIVRGRFTVPVGQGIIGFCALEGICLRVSDMQKDPHYAATIANAVGYAVKDTLCASAEKDGRLYGAIQLLNSKGGFSAVHMEVLRYIGLTAAQLLERHFESA